VRQADLAENCGKNIEEGLEGQEPRNTRKNSEDLHSPKFRVFRGFSSCFSVIHFSVKECSLQSVALGLRTCRAVLGRNNSPCAVTPCDTFRLFLSRSKTMTKPIPEGYHTITPTFAFKNTRKAIEFYKKAFGATEKYVMPGPDGQGVMHAELKIGDSTIMLGDENPEYSCKSAETLGGSPISLYLYVKDVDAAFERAVSAGGTSQMPVQDMFWGDRVGTFLDPFGHRWSLATHVADVSPEEMARGAEAMCAGAGKN
jgi:uncharacterized glyoxalase superfamily protein PhnB